MKQLEVNQMEELQGGGTPSAGQVTCYLISVGYGLVNPLAGIVSGALCLFVD